MRPLPASWYPSAVAGQVLPVDSTCRGPEVNRRITVRDIEISAGAGFVVPILLSRDRSCGEIVRMPGLPEVPASEHMDIDANGVIRGVS
ncbi:MAG: formate--tetrahydrofolate ligase [Flavobacteriales bacterium]|nr:formate--tetrahydrofolate ligase [Flavobacteriales bacterium]